MIEEKKVLIRADGNAKIGAGHLMRCLTIADAFPNKEQIGFICADEESAALAESKGYDAYVLHTNYQDMEQELSGWKILFLHNGGCDFSGTTNSDHAGANQAISTKRVILVDSYHVTNAYLENLRTYGRVILLDDMAKFAWNAEAVINYNAFATSEMYVALNSPYDTKYYLGGAYIPIRKEFVNRDYRVREQAKHVLITTGGGDSENIAGQILSRIWSDACEYHVVTGRFNPHYESLQQKAKEQGNIHIYHNVQDMAALMLDCDVAITAGGTTVYELSSIGVPLVCFSYAENQEKLTEYIGIQRIAGYGGAFHKDAEKTLDTIAEQVEALILDKELRKQYNLSEKKLVDGQGAVRIAEIIGSLR